MATAMYARPPNIERYVSLHVHLKTLNLRFLGAGDGGATASEYRLLSWRERAPILLLLSATRPALAGNVDDVVRSRDAAAAGSWSFATPSRDDGASFAKARIDEAIALEWTRNCGLYRKVGAIDAKVYEYILGRE